MSKKSDFDLETWIVETGHEVLQKEAFQGLSALTPIEKLIRCLWAADYGMRNAGDLETAADVQPRFQEDGALLATMLGLKRTQAAFGLPMVDLELRYFDLLDEIVAEISDAYSRQ